jgi:hypothetical protein
MGGKLAPTAVELVGRLAILVAFYRFHGMAFVESRSLRYESYVRMQHFARRSYVPFRWFWGMCFEKSCYLFLMLFLVRWIHVFAMLCIMEVPMLRHVSLFLGLRHERFFLPCFSFLIDSWFPLIFLVRDFVFRIWLSYIFDVIATDAYYSTSSRRGRNGNTNFSRKEA